MLRVYITVGNIIGHYFSLIISMRHKLPMVETEQLLKGYLGYSISLIYSLNKNLVDKQEGMKKY